MQGEEMNLITLDFETYYAQDYSLTKLTTEEYIRDKRFEVIGVGVKLNDGVTEWFSGSHIEIQKYLSTLPWNASALLCHNTMFDGAILKWRFGISPKLYLDTLCMGRATNGVDVGGSLAYLAERYKLGIKGTEVVEAKGKNITGFTNSELAQYGEYCKNDVELTFKLFQVLSSAFPEEELNLIDMTLRMFIHPILQVDDALLLDRLEELKHEKLQLLGTLKEKLNCENEEAVRKRLASNKQFAGVLKEFNIQVPMKISPTTGKETFALAKNDTGFIELVEHEDPFIQQLAAVRLGTKSTIEESRIERFIDIGARNKGKLPIPLKYYGAHTGRWAGLDKVNFQNLPSRDKKKKTLKNAIIAPEGYMVINCDSSQIEARVLAWLSGQKGLVKSFADGNDVYSEFASKIYERPISKKDPVERFVGKTCILGLGYGTGALKLQHTLKTSPPGADLTEDMCKDIVNLYRTENDQIVKLWKEGDKALKAMADWAKDKKPFYYGQHKCVEVYSDGIRLPNELYIRYPELQLNTDETTSGYQYKSRKGPVSLWGGSVVENVVQALARIIVGEQMLKLTERYRPVLTVHDAAVCVVPEDEVNEACAWIVEVMSTPPDWAKGLPVTCEAQYGYNYGEMQDWHEN
jgi:DNA polymerase I-like protein with 3'-5' exonuclease and polymerase domains